MKGYRINDGYFIVMPFERGERTVEVHPLFANIEKYLKDEPNKGTLGWFVEKAVIARENNTDLKLTSGEVKRLGRYLPFDTDISEIQQNNDMYWRLVKAIVAKEGVGKYILANLVKNLFVWEHNELVTVGIISKSDVIALNCPDTFEDAFRKQQNLENLISQVRIFEHDEEYREGDFSNLPQSAEQI